MCKCCYLDDMNFVSDFIVYYVGRVEVVNVTLHEINLLTIRSSYLKTEYFLGLTSIS
jgi:hypothetical protein